MNAQNRTAEIAKAREVDTEVARLWSLFHDVNDKATELTKAANKSEKVIYQYSATQRPRIQERIAKQREQAAAIREEAAPLKAAAIAYDKANYEGWNRFFLVVHIHRTAHCSSFRPTTRVGWLPDVSGLTEAEAVAAHGETLCTICFPSAPTELTTKKVADDICAGSGRYRSTTKTTGREHSYYGKSGYCTVCDTVQTVTATGNIRKHKTPTN